MLGSDPTKIGKQRKESKAESFHQEKEREGKVVVTHHERVDDEVVVLEGVEGGGGRDSVLAGLA